MTKSSKNITRMVISSMMLALCMVLPFLTGQIPQIGSKLSPMHIPVLLCGFICGGPWGMLVGAIAPILRSLIFGMPPLFPTATAMAFELAAYGLISGLLYKALPKNNFGIYASLIGAMIAGRLVWGTVMYFLLMAQGSVFTIEKFYAGAVANAVPGIIVHIVLIPIIVMAVKRAGFILNK